MRTQVRYQPASDWDQDPEEDHGLDQNGTEQSEWLEGQPPIRRGRRRHGRETHYRRIVELADAILARLPEDHDLDDWETVVDEVLVLPRLTQTWKQHVGPVYTRQQLRRLLATDDHQIDARVASGTLLGCTTREGVEIFPAFQFVGGELLRGLPDVLGEFEQTPVDRWTLTSWLVTPLRHLDGLTPVEWLRKDRNADAVLLLASDQAARWSR